MKVVYRRGDYDIREGRTPEGILYDVYSTKADDPITGGLILGNRKTLEEAKRDLDEYVSSGGVERWGSLGGLLRSSTNIRGWDIDPPIRDLVRDLNGAGLATVGSCSGHGKKEGFVTFSIPEFSEEDKDLISSVFVAHGIHRLRFVDRPNSTGIVFFPPMK